jgi:hypothetical protein
MKIYRRVFSLSSVSVLLHVPTCKMHKLNLLGTCKMSIKCIEEASSEDTIIHQKVTLSVLNYYNIVLLPIQDVVVMKLHIKSTCFRELVGI